MDGEESLKPGEVSTGTTIMACTYDGGVVIGSDTRTTSGQFISNRVTNKLTHVYGKIYCCRSGSAADTQVISDYVKIYTAQNAILTNREPSVHSVAHLFQSMCYGNREQLVAGIICAGIDPYEGPQVYKIPLGGMLVREPYSIGGSGSTYLYGYCDEHFRPGMTRAECEAFVLGMVSHAQARDGSSGGCVRLVTITSEGEEARFVANPELPI